MPTPYYHGKQSGGFPCPPARPQEDLFKNKCLTGVTGRCARTCGDCHAALCLNPYTSRSVAGVHVAAAPSTKHLPPGFSARLMTAAGLGQARWVCSGLPGACPGLSLDAPALAAWAQLCATRRLQSREGHSSTATLSSSLLLFE